MPHGDWRLPVSDILAAVERIGRYTASLQEDVQAKALIVALPAHPIVTGAPGQKLLGRSKQAVNGAIAVLAESGCPSPSSKNTVDKRGATRLDGR